MRNPLSNTIVTIPPSGIRKFFDIVSEMEGAISLGVGEPDFDTPWHVRDAGIRSLEMGKTFYTSNAGLKELKQEICSYLKRRMQVEYDYNTEVMVTIGGSEAIDLALRCILNPGDEVIIPVPSFVCYGPLTSMAGGTPVYVELKAENEFRLTAAQLRAALTPRTKAVVLPFPSNPTGGILERADLEELAGVLKDTNAMVLSDEIYAELTYGQKHVSPANLPELYDRTIVVNGFSKSHAMTGWRMGYAVGPKELIAPMTKLHQYAIMSAPTMSQYASIEALRNGDDDIAEMRDEYDMRRRLIVDGLNRLGLTCFEPEGAFYVFPSIRSTGMTSNEFCERLIYDKRVAVVPGSAFGACGEGHIRISYAYSVKHLTEALERMAAFLETLR